jgi:hypothetical protein
MKRTTILGFCFTALVALAVWAPNVLAYSNGSGCASCHSFKGTSHDNHTAKYDCFVCHVQKGDDPVVVDSCGTCHGGGEAIQTRHIVNYGEASCEGCHLQSSPTPTCIDGDGDGYGNPGDSSCANGPAIDCNDEDRLINPGAVEICNDLKDNNCNSLTDSDDGNCPVVNCTDSDKDGYNLGGGECGPVDCEDEIASINPGAEEDCTDRIDNDCDGNIDSLDLDCYTCVQHTDRGNCKADPSCNYSRKRGCYEVEDGSIYTNQSSCEEAFGRWNKKKETCTIR